MEVPDMRRQQVMAKCGGSKGKGGRKGKGGKGGCK